MRRALLRVKKKVLDHYDDTGIQTPLVLGGVAGFGWLCYDVYKSAKELKVEREKLSHDIFLKNSMDLPSGWKAYYDEKFQEALYVNAETSEVSLYRPR